ncbi:positive regulator of late transcription, partial [Pseudonocardia sp. TMWB2A]|uniref:Mor transcription activator family protein n=1 Tax=Pseudonocardia sp. TMWB2A TaxID=687430 RepID=UPI00307F2CF0
QTLVQILEVQEAALIETATTMRTRSKSREKTTLALAEYMGGRSLYIPRGDALKIAIRDAEIFRVANRRNIRQLSRRHNVSERHIWRILNRQQRLHVRKLQPDLFNKPE